MSGVEITALSTQRTGSAGFSPSRRTDSRATSDHAVSFKRFYSFLLAPALYLPRATL